MLCIRCNQDQPPENFHRDHKSASGRQSYCRSCKRAYSKVRNQLPEVKAAQREIAKRWYWQNTEKRSAYYKEFSRRPEARASDRARHAKRRLEQPERFAEYRRRDYERHPERVRRSGKTYRAMMKQATPAWADLDAIKMIYKEAGRRRSEGDAVHVDHIVPIRHALVCGLHVAANLEIVPNVSNWSKGNRHWPDMP